MRIKPLKGIWVVITANNTPLLWTIAGTRKMAISLLYDDMNELERTIFWNKRLEKGYSVVKVNLYFEAKVKLK